MGGFSTLTPEQQAMLMQQMQGVGGGNQPQNQPLLPPGPSQQPPQMPRFQPTQQGGMLPTGTAVSTPRGIQPSAAPPRQQRGVSGTGGPGMLIAGIVAAKQAGSKKKQDEAYRITSAWLSLMQSGDPALKQQADELMQKHVKMFDKAQDPAKGPLSPEYQGIQQAFRAIEQQDQQKMAMQQLQQSIAEVAARAQAERQRGEYYRQLGEAAEKRGEVTPQDIFRQGEQDRRLAATLKSKGELQRTSIDAMNKRVDEKIKSLEKIASEREAGAMARAQLHEKGATGRAKMRTMQNQAATVMMKQYTNIRSEIANLDKEQKNLTTELGSTEVSRWVQGTADDFQSRSAQIEQKRAELESRLGDLDTNVDQMMQSGIINKPAAAPADKGGNKPIVVSPEDMQ